MYKFYIYVYNENNELNKSLVKTKSLPTQARGKLALKVDTCKNIYIKSRNRYIRFCKHSFKLY